MEEVKQELQSLLNHTLEKDTRDLVTTLEFLLLLRVVEDLIAKMEKRYGRDLVKK